MNSVEGLSTTTHTQPYAPYAAFTDGLISKWTYLTRTTGNLLLPLEEVIMQTEFSHFSYRSKKCLQLCHSGARGLPLRLGGLRITDSSTITTAHYDVSKKITAPLKCSQHGSNNPITIPTPQMLNNSELNRYQWRLRHTATRFLNAFTVQSHIIIMAHGLV